MADNEKNNQNQHHHLEEKIEDTRAKCKEKLQLYQNSTESFTSEYTEYTITPEQAC